MHTVSNAPHGRRGRCSIATLSSQASARRRGIQIGPKIRIGGSVGKIGQNVKNAVTKGATDVGHAVGKIADNKYAQMAAAAALTSTGVGAPAAAGIMAGMAGGGKLLAPGGNIGDAALAAGKAGVASYGAGKLGSAVLGKVPGATRLGGALKNLPGVSTVGEIAGGISDKAKSLLPDWLGGLVSGGGSDGTGNWGALGDELGRVKTRLGNGESPIAGLGGLGGGGGDGGGGGTSWLDKLLMGGTVAAGAMDELDKRNLRNKATDYTTNSYDARAPLRARAMALLADDTPPDMTATFDDPGNVYAVQRRARAKALLPAGSPSV